MVKSYHCFKITVLLNCLRYLAGSDSFGRAKMYDVLFSKRNYDRSIPPNVESHKPTQVEVDIYVHSIDAVSESTMDFTVNMFLYLEWFDHRLIWKFDLGNSSYLEVDVTAIERAWVPDLFFPNEKTAFVHKVTLDNKLFRIYRNGEIFYATRISLTLGCPMDLKKYPLDEQSCPIQIQSFGYSETKVALRWSNISSPLYNEDMRLAQFEVISGIRGHCPSKMHPRSEHHSCLEARFHLARNLGFYLVQIYIPSVLIVMLSWVSFWLNVDSVPARISLGVLTVLTMTTQTSGAGITLPRVSYTKAIDIWMVTCLVFVFFALIEFAVANVLMRGYKSSMDNPSEGYRSKERIMIVKEDGVTKLGDIQSLLRLNGARYARNIDFLSRIFFPLAFGIFNFMYWLLYTL